MMSQSGEKCILMIPEIPGCDTTVFREIGQLQTKAKLLPSEHVLVGKKNEKTYKWETPAPNDDDESDT